MYSIPPIYAREKALECLVFSRFLHKGDSQAQNEYQCFANALLTVERILLGCWSRAIFEARRPPVPLL